MKEFCMKKNIVFAALALLLAVTVFAQTEEDFTVELTKDGEGVVIAKYNGNAARVQIPATIQGMPVREIGYGAFRQAVSMKSVVIPQGVTKIGDEAFINAGLISVTFPEGLTEIGKEAFQGCEQLTAITLPQSLTTLGDMVFAATQITAVTLPAALSKSGYGVFRNCWKLQTVTIPEGLTAIPDSMFSSCTALTAIALPASIKTIGSGAFHGCEALTAVTIPETVTSIQFGRGTYSSQDTFNECPKLTLATQALLKKVGYTGGFN
jgi:hypothetical protein